MGSDRRKVTVRFSHFFYQLSFECMACAFSTVSLALLRSPRSKLHLLKGALICSYLLHTNVLFFGHNHFRTRLLRLATVRLSVDGNTSLCPRSAYIFPRYYLYKVCYTTFYHRPACGLCLLQRSSLSTFRLGAAGSTCNCLLLTLQIPYQVVGLARDILI